MFFWVAIALVVAITVFLVIKDGGYDTGVIIFCGLTFGGLAVLVYLGIIMSIWAGGGTAGINHRTHTETSSLAAVGNGTQVKGSLGHSVFAYYGSFESEQTINYVKQDAQGGYHLSSNAAKNSVIYQTDSEKPHIVEEHWANEKDYTLWLPWAYSDDEYAVQATLYVPEGTVSSNYEIDPGK